MAEASNGGVMESIQSLGYPLGYKAAQPVAAGEANGAAGPPERRAFYTAVRSLEGMQKEAVIAPVDGRGGTWRMVSDEGPYLDGTDLAPFPLAFFTTGLQFCFMDSLLRYARAHRLPLARMRVAVDSRYSMKGSFLKGDARGSAEPALVEAETESSAPGADLERVSKAALLASPAHAAMREPLADTFALVLNGRSIALESTRPSRRGAVRDPLESVFAGLVPAPGAMLLPDAIAKVKTAARIDGVEGGAGSSLAPVQDRTLHVRGEAAFGASSQATGLFKETVVSLYRPIGSSFRLLGDETLDHAGQDRAPSALAYLSAGIGFCFMTQISRYAHILKLAVRSIRIVQFTAFSARGSAADWTLAGSAEPVDTHVFIEADEPEATARKIVEMGEQTCFLHAALAGSLPSRIEVAKYWRPLKA
jgi:uncharacterized OsmC-like protein